MKINVMHIGIRSSHEMDSWIEAQIAGLQPRLQIDKAEIRLVRQHAASPAYQAHIHLATPGPDIMAFSQDHTLRAAVNKVLLEVQDKISSRSMKRLHKRKSNLSAPAGIVRRSRNHSL